ncbi:YheC/YheD family protein [Cytobacillus depressus]|uniref:YheC/YheD family protein n=1 Tax=Cytobacillus depressus TaxID=1602942 RepID=A0A6L3VBM7_9BACI|nr:YheC/YheD family protein [Cytobacillus depressus]KAB2337110.1 YheC/YheD family protein [Cytobacillus depressus]
MIQYYDPEQKTWLNMATNEDMPVIGILTGSKKDNKITGNGRLFRELQKEISKNGGLSVVFTPQKIKDQSIDGYMYEPNKDKWYTAICSFPHVIYNRVPFQKLEKSKPYQEALQLFKNKQIPFFNYGFLNKYELFQIFSRDTFFQPLFPKTITIHAKPSLHTFLEKHGQLYLKPANGSKGKGIYLLHLNNDGSIRLEGQKEERIYHDFHSFWIKRSHILLKKSYIAQEAILPFLYNGKRFDFRILVHFQNNHYEVIGIGIRQAKEQDITTHIPNGGVIIPYEEVQTLEHDQFISEVANKAGRLLSKEIGFFGEFSIDAGISEDGRYIIYEINSKPMKFDEKEIEEKRIQSLVRLFFELAGLNKKV